METLIVDVEEKRHLASPAAGGKKIMGFRGLPQACWEFSTFENSKRH
jgi:hypothetical protein